MPTGKMAAPAAGASPAIPRAPSASTEASDDFPETGAPSTSSSLRYLAQPQISCQELVGLLDSDASSCQLIDVREPLEFRQSHISGALNHNRELFTHQAMSRLAEDFAPGTKTIVLYCHSGQRAAPCASKLGQHLREQHLVGVEVKVLAGGYAAFIRGTHGGWLSNGLSGLASAAGRRIEVKDPLRHVEKAPQVTVDSKEPSQLTHNKEPIGRGRAVICGRVFQCGTSEHRFY